MGEFTHMKLGVPDLVTNSYFPAIAAVELGYFRNEGLDVDIELIYPQTMDALRDGEVDLAADCAHAVLETFPGWRGARLLMALAQGMYWQLIMSRNLNIAPGDLRSLQGRRIGAGPGVDLVLIHLLREAGIEPRQHDIHISPVPGSDTPGASFGVTAAQALEAGEIDGFWANAMGAETAIRSGLGAVILDVRRGIGPSRARHYTFSALVGAERSIRDQPQIMESAVRAVCNAQRALRKEPTLARQVGERLFPLTQAEMIAEVVRRDIDFYDPEISAESVLGVNSFARAMGLPSEDAPYDNVVATGFTSLWGEAR